MPEGVEIRVIADQLSKKLVGKTIKSLSQIGGRFLTKNELSLLVLEKELPLTIKNINCKGKFLYWKLEKDWYLFNTLGMTGKWSTEQNKHAAVEIKTDSETVYFEDIRRFGTLKAAQGHDKLDTKLNKLGPDMLSNPPDENLFLTRVGRCLKQPIVQFLMDQSHISGVGNYIKAEALYRAKISPHRLGFNMDVSTVRALRTAIIEVMQESYQMQGATFLTYGSLEGAGKYASFFKVYRKAQDPLGNEVISEETADKRTTWWVPSVQK